MSLASSESTKSTELNVTLRLTQRSGGNFAATIVEFPECQVEAATRDEAIALVKTTFLKQLPHIETIPWNIPLQANAPWMRSAGIFQDNAAFEDVMNRVQAERDAWNDEEMDVSEYTR